MVDGILFKNKHSYRDFNISIKERNISYPEANYITESIPYKTGYLDFTEIFGSLNYNERLLTYKFNILSENVLHKADNIINWLKGDSQNELKDDGIKGFFFKAQAESWEIERIQSNYVILTVVFRCYPLKIRNIAEGNFKWDDFVFSTDTLQQTEFILNNEDKEITLINNSSVEITPYINSIGNLVIKFQDVELKLTDNMTSERIYYLFKLAPGANKFTVSGTGNIEFIWKNEVL